MNARKWVGAHGMAIMVGLLVLTLVVAVALVAAGYPAAGYAVSLGGTAGALAVGALIAWLGDR